jgi:hypothetical protein
MTRKKKVATGQVLPPKSGAMYNNRPIPPDYARVEVTWTHDDYDDEEIDFPTEEEATNLRGTLGCIVLWNKEDIIMDMLTPRSKPSEPSTSPPGGGSGDDDAATADGNGTAGGPGNSPPHSPCPNTSNPQGGKGGAPGNKTPPPSQGTGKCLSAPEKPTEEEGTNLPTSPRSNGLRTA